MENNTFITEGTADWAMLYMFHHDVEPVQPNWDYRWGYETGAYFLQWLQTNYDMPTALHDANVAERDSAYDDSIFTDKAGGKSLDDLWAICKTTLPN